LASRCPWWSPLLVVAAAHAQSVPEEATGPARGVSTALDLAALYDTLDPRSLQAAAERGPAWLAEHQEENGGWLGHVGHKQQDNYYILHSAAAQRARGGAHLGVTAFCGLAFLAGGHLPGRGKHGKVMDAA